MSKPARRSRIAIAGADRIAHRAYFKATGLDGGYLHGDELIFHAMRPVERHGGVLEKYAKLVGPAHLGAVTHSGAVDWKHE